MRCPAPGNWGSCPARHSIRSSSASSGTAIPGSRASRDGGLSRRRTSSDPCSSATSGRRAELAPSGADGGATRGCAGDSAGERYKLAPLLRAPLTAGTERPDRRWRTSSRCSSRRRATTASSASTTSRRSSCRRLPSLYGAMLADVDVVLMGAGIPRRDPGRPRSARRRHEAVSLRLDVAGRRRSDVSSSTSIRRRSASARRRPAAGPAPTPDASSRSSRPRPSPRPSCASRRTASHGFVVEGPIAGGHNAPPRGQLQLDERGEPVYGERDVVDLEQMQALGVPFWLAGAYGSRERFAGSRGRRRARRPGRHRLRVLRGVGPGSGAARDGSSRS